MKKTVLLSLICATAVSANVFADNNLPPPSQCPATIGIINSGLMSAEKIAEEGIWVAGQIHRYETPYTWAFMIAIPVKQANNPQEALQKAREVLPYLAGNPHPLPYNGRYVCMYNDLPRGYKAIAVEPVMMAAMSHISLFK